jgi:hypothetical protein
MVGRSPTSGFSLFGLGRGASDLAQSTTSAFDLISLYQRYFGRYPEDSSVMDFHSTRSGGDYQSLRRGLLLSNEYKKHVFDAVPSRGGTFFSIIPDAPKICVLGNCQAPNIARAVAAIAQEPVSVCGLEIMDVFQSAPEMVQLVKGADFVIPCQTYSKEYDVLSVDTIKNEYKKVTYEYSPIHFTGLHPDILTLGSFGKRIQSPLGDYNSRIILSSYINSLTEAKCVESFRTDTYERAGYFYEFGWSTDTLLRREEALGDGGIRIAAWFVDEIKRAPLLYTVNHPTSRVFVKYAQLVLDAVGLKYRSVPAELVNNSLANDVFWPIDSAFSEKNGVKYSTEAVFWRNNVSFSLDEFVWRSYRAYQQIGAEALRVAMDERVIPM